MTALFVEVAGKYVPLERCDWVLWAPCGCPIGVTVGALPAPYKAVSATEEAAWKSLYDRKRDIAAAQKRGEHMELMTHERWGTEVMPRMQARCPHRGAA